MEHNENKRHQNHIQESIDELDTSHVAEGKAGYYTLPSRRFTTIVQGLLFLDLVSSVTLWLCGGNNDYLEENVQHFKFKESVFDLAVIAFLRCSILFFVYPWLESISLKQIDQPYDKNLAFRKCFCHFLCIIFCAGSLTYSVTKGTLIFEDMTERHHKLHPTYFALAITAIVFSLLEMLFALGSFAAMRRLKVQRILNTSIIDTGSRKKQKVNLGRLMTLAKPVSSVFG